MVLAEDVDHANAISKGGKTITVRYLDKLDCKNERMKKRMGNTFESIANGADRDVEFVVVGGSREVSRFIVIDTHVEILADKGA